MMVGVARNMVGTLAHWQDLGAYRATDSLHTGIRIGESPMVCRDSSGTGAWRIFLTNGLYDSIGSNSQYFLTETPGYSVSDTTLGHWPDLDNLFTYLGSDSALLALEACEHLQVGKAHFFAGYNGDGIAITQAHWDPTTGNFLIGYPSLAGVGDKSPTGRVRFCLSEFRPGAPLVRFVVDLPSLMSPCLTVYDLAGRRLRTLAEGQLMQGRHEFRWDCRDAQGASVQSGVYFARLTNAGAPQVLHVPVVR